MSWLLLLGRWAQSISGEQGLYLRNLLYKLCVQVSGPKLALIRERSLTGNLDRVKSRLLLLLVLSPLSADGLRLGIDSDTLRCTSSTSPNLHTSRASQIRTVLSTELKILELWLLVTVLNH